MRGIFPLILSSALLLSVNHPAGAATAETNRAGIPMVTIPAGHFQMGQAEREVSFKAPWSAEKDKGADFDEQPVRQIEITSAFSISCTPITNAQYEQFEPAHASKRPKRDVSHEDDAAVINVNWDDAAAYCQWLSTKENKFYRLPTEAEWEYTCRAGTATLFNTGDTLPDGYQQLVPGLMMAFHYYFPEENSLPAYYQLVKQSSLRVAQHPANAWGLSDMHGIVAEWCQDWYGPYEAAATRDPVGPATGDFRVLRGGAHSQLARLLRSANRASMEPWVRNNWIGFRVVAGEPVQTPPSPVTATATLPTAAAPISIEPEKLDSTKPIFEGPEQYVNIPPHSEGPLFSGHNHDPGLTVCPNGDVLAVWYTTDEEVGSELNVAASRRLAGTNIWTPATLFWQCADANNHAPALFTDEDGTIYHFNGSKMLPGAVVRTSKDNGCTWTSASFFNDSTQPSEATIRTSDGRLLATLDGQFWSGVVTASADHGKTWTQLTDDSTKPNFTPGATGRVIAGIHVGLAERRDGTLWALGRIDDLKADAAFENKLPASTSSDGGKTLDLFDQSFPGNPHGPAADPETSS